MKISIDKETVFIFSRLGYFVEMAGRVWYHGLKTGKYERRESKTMKIETYFEEIDRAYESLSGAELEKSLTTVAEKAGREFGRDGAVYASMCSELGGFYRGQGRFAESEEYFRQALRLLGNVCGTEHPDYATGLNNLAGTLRKQGRFEEAESLFAQALEIYRKTLGEGHILFASGLNNLSLVCLDRGDAAAAGDYLMRASEILDKQPEYRDELAAALCNLGSLHRQTGDRERAEEELLRAVGMFEKELGTATPHYHAALCTLGLVYLEDGQAAKACDYLKRACVAAEKLYGAEHYETKMTAAYRKKAEEAL